MPAPKFPPHQIIGVDVFLERFQTRIYVGRLHRPKKRFIFSYDEKYLNMNNVLPLGPDFPLTQKDFSAEKLFPSFLDRLPDPESASYSDDCTHVGIAITTTDPIVLLSRFKRGPSSFIFEPVYKPKYSYKDIERLKNELELSLQDMAYLFDVSLSSLQKIKTGSTSGNEILRRVELYLEVPEALEFQMQRNAKYLHPEKVEKTLHFLKEKKEEKAHMINRWQLLGKQECDYTQECLKALQSCGWAKDLIEKINRLGFLPPSMSTMFEVRFAYAFYNLGLSVQNGYRAGTKNSELKDSDVDFLVTKADSSKWLIELTSLDESEGVKKETVSGKNTWVFSSRITPGDQTNSREVVELIRAQSAILSKVGKFKNKDKKEVIPTKFPEPTDGNYNIIVIDMRGFVTGVSDRKDYINILYGVKSFKNKNDKELYGRVCINPETGHQTPLIGILDSEHPDPRAKYLRERIHGIGFVCESLYDEGELQTVIELFPNGSFFKNEESIRKLFPMQKDASYAPDSKPPLES